MKNKMRLAIKTSTYGLLHVIVAMLVAYALTGNIKIAIGFGLIEPVIQMIVFSIHEYVWEKNKIYI
ncbi:DUF2061 domain-containing protein [Candidatus Pelagibacter sp.]|jgi:uncharacterized membrane protein|nr:DUF2061 domain-containing protein [Candidatus Pelagibacter sp.]